MMPARAVEPHQHDRVLAGVKARRFAPPPLRSGPASRGRRPADGLDAGCAHGPGRPCPTARGRSAQENPKSDVLTETWVIPFSRGHVGVPISVAASTVPRRVHPAAPRRDP